MKTIVCVLKSGVFKPWAEKEYTTGYEPRHVQWLRDQFAAQMPVPHRFVCMSDLDIPGVEVIPLQDNLPGWWSKLEIFREFQSAAYVDLDTVVIGDVSPMLFTGHDFLISAHMTRRHGVNSSIMSWNSDCRFIYDTFRAAPLRYMKEFTFSHKWGDQDFINETILARSKTPIAKFQHYFPKFALSYKYDIRDRGLPTKWSARRRLRLDKNWLSEPHIVAFHGKPKPEAVQDDHIWIPKLCAV